MNKVLSIIIPIYNVEVYIRRCLDSIYNQHVSDELFEIIAVNDGSPDNSMHIVEEFMKCHTNLKIINKSNGGVSSARNMGVSIALGNYLLFVDPDDYICQNSLSALIMLLDKKCNDIFVLRSYISDSNHTENYKWIELFNVKQSYTGDHLLKQNYVRGSVCGCAFLKSFIKSNEILFPEGIANFEDTIFMILSMCYAKSIRFVDIDFYEVFVRAGSASTSVNSNRVIKSAKGLEYVNQYIEKHNLTALQISMIEYLKYSIISNATLFLAKCKDLTCKEFINQTNINKYLPIKSNLIKKQKTKILILNYSFRLYYILILIKSKLK